MILRPYLLCGLIAILAQLVEHAHGKGEVRSSILRDGSGTKGLAPVRLFCWLINKAALNASAFRAALLDYTAMEVIRLTAENIEQYLPQCLSLQRQLIKPDEVPNEELFLRTAGDERTCMLGLIEDQKLVGLGVIGLLTHPAHVTAHVDNIVVDDAYRGRGFFTVIMDALEAQAALWGADEITLTCSRPAVQPLYERREYKERETKYYRKKI